MNPRTDLLVRLMLVIGGAVSIALLGRWLFSRFISPGLPANIICLFLLGAGGLALHELMNRNGDRIMMRLFHRRSRDGDWRP
ncbi:MAG: hypothetical protein ABIR63_01235 [Sphingomicrobium sp.]